RLARAWLSLILEMEELWLQTRKRSEAELRLLAEVKRIREAGGRRVRAAELQIAHMRARVQFPELGVPSRAALALRDLNLRLTERLTYSRIDLRHFWSQTRRRWKRHQILRIRPHRIAWNLIRDFELMLIFALALARERVPAAAER
ncbi:MAG: hypothetical protein ABIG68_04185, partial [Acidobacteriota bacterium]